MPIKIVFLIILLSGIIALATTAFSRTTTKNPAIVTSFYPLYYFATQIGDSQVAVVNLTPPGTEPHEYDPTPRDIATIESSSLLIINGGLEAWADKIKNQLIHTVIVIAGQDLIINNDPHVWLSPRLAQKEVQVIASAMAAITPASSGTYQKNAADLSARLQALDQSYRQGLKDCQLHDFVTTHTAFNYLAKEYGINQVALAGLSPDTEPASQKIAEIAKFIENKKIKYIFFEKLISPKLAETLAVETGVKTLVLDPLEGLTPQEIASGDNYFSVMSANLTNLRLALQCR